MSGEEWLKAFFQVVDHNRLNRGKKLYRDDHLLKLKKQKDGFFAVVQGSGYYQYDIDARFETDEDGMPDLEKLSVDCSCKDWVEFCKHAICAMIGYCEEGNSRSFVVFDEKKTDVEHILSRDMEQLMDLGSLPVLGKERSFDKMQSIVQKKIREQSL
ncbi:MAG TPA: hypothetical protein VFK37_09400 [Bacillales bacterium]|nr:hypothetical protein [Bacillales bacterium]